MLAYILNSYGRPEGSSFMKVPMPKPISRQLLARVRAAGLRGGTSKRGGEHV